MYVYIWARSGAYPGGMYAVPEVHYKTAALRLAMIRGAEPGFTWVVYHDATAADAHVRVARRYAGGSWAGDSSLLFCATLPMRERIAAMVAASEWLWRPLPGMKRGPFS
jgi:hypothetical protein